MLFQLPAIKKKKITRKNSDIDPFGEEVQDWGDFFTLEQNWEMTSFQFWKSVCASKVRLIKPILIFNKSTFPLKLVCIGDPKGRHMVHSCGCELKWEGFVQWFSHGSLAFLFLSLHFRWNILYISASTSEKTYEFHGLANLLMNYNFWLCFILTGGVCMRQSIIWGHHWSCLWPI